MTMKILLVKNETSDIMHDQCELEQNKFVVFNFDKFGCCAINY